jgi:hypothetical protein
MAISEEAQRNHDTLFPNHESTLKATDPELVEVFDNWAFGEVIRDAPLDPRTRLMVQLAAIITCQAVNEYRVMVREFEGNSASPNPAVPIWILREVLLVMVGAEAFSRTEITELYRHGHAAGRLSVDVAVDPAVDQASVRFVRCPGWESAASVVPEVLPFADYAALSRSLGDFGA